MASSALSPAILSPAMAQQAAPPAPTLQLADSQSVIATTSEGTPVVNISTPNAQGVSHNVFTAFSTGVEGLILNNATAKGRSEIGGTMGANPNLAGKTAARLIVNEVTGGIRTRLAGPIEVFGNAAGLIIANPTGITCDGCGFINAPRVSLAAANVQFGPEGAFSGFTPSGGNVVIEGKGLLAGNVDFFDIIASSTLINASIHAKDLLIASGNATFNYAARTATSAANNGGTTAGVAVDSSALGGMYANKIRIIGSGAGVGVNLSGIVATLDGPLDISADGAVRLTNVAATGDATITSNGGSVTLTDQTYATGNLTVSANAIEQTGGVTAARGDVTLSSTGNVTLSNGRLYAGLDADGNLSAPAATLRIAAAGQFSAETAQVASAGKVVTQSGSTALASGSRIAGREIELTATGTQDLAGTVQATENLGATGATVRISGKITANGLATISASDFELSGELSGNSISVASIGTGAATDKLVNKGSVLAAQNITLSTAGTLSQDGTVHAGEKLDLIGKSVELTGKTSTAASPSGLLALQGETVVVAAGADVEAGANLQVQASESALLQGNLTARGTARIGGSGAVTIAGNVVSADRLYLTGATQTVSGNATGLQGVETDLDRLDITATGELHSGKNVSLNAGAVNNAGLISARELLEIKTTGLLDNSGNIIGAGRSELTAGTDLTSTGLMQAGTDLVATAGNATIDGKFIAQNNAEIRGDALSLKGQLSVTGQLKTASTGNTTFADTSSTFAGGSIDATASDLAVNGTIQSDGGIDFAAQNDLTVAGEVLSRGAATLSAVNQSTISGTLTSDGLLTLTGGSVDLPGSVQANGKAAITANNGNLNLTGLLLASGDVALKAARELITGTAGGIMLAPGGIIPALPTNPAGNPTLLPPAIATNGSLTMEAEDIAIINGIYAKDNLSLTATNRLTVDVNAWSDAAVSASAKTLIVSATGTLAGKGPLSLSGTDLLTIRGDVSTSEGDLSLTGKDIDLAAGSAVTSSAGFTLASSANATIGGNITATRAANLTAGGNLTLAASGIVDAGATLAANAAGTLTTAAGSTVSVMGAASFVADVLQYDGQFTGNAALTLDAKSLLAFGGTASARDKINVNVTGLANITGTLSSANGLIFTADDLNLGAASNLASNGDISITASKLVTAGQIEGADLTAITTGDATLGGQLSAGRTDANGAIVTLGEINVNSGGVLDVTAKGTATGKAALAAATVKFNGDFSSLNDIAITGNDIATLANAKAVAGSALNIQSTGSAQLQGSLQGLQSLNVNSAGNLNQNAALATNGQLSLTANGLLSHGGTSTAVEKVSMAGAGLDVGGTVRSAQELILSSTAQTLKVANGAQLTAPVVSLTSAANTEIAGVISAPNSISVNSGTDSEVSIASTGKLLAGTTNAQGGTVTAGSITIGAGNALANLAVTNAGELFSTGQTRFNTRVLNTTGTLSSNENLTITAARLNLGGTVASKGNVSADATEGLLQVSGTLTGQNITLMASADPSAAGAATDAGDMSLIAGSNLKAYGTGTAGKVALSAGHDIEARGVIHANNDIALTAGNLLTTQGVDTARPGLAPLRAISTSAKVYLTAGSTLTVLDTVQGDQGVILNAPSLDLNNLLTNGALEFETTGAIQLRGWVYAKGGVKLTSTGSTLTLGDGASLESDNAIVLKSKNAITNAGRIIGGIAGNTTNIGTITLTSDESGIFSNGLLYSHNSSINLTGSSVTIGSPAAGIEGKVYAAKPLNLTTPVLTLQDNATVIANDAFTYTGQHMNLGAGSLLQSNNSVTLNLGTADNAGSFDSSGKIVALTDLSVAVAGDLGDQNTGQISNREGSSLIAGGAGATRAGGSVTLSAAKITNDGIVAATASAAGTNGNLTLVAPEIANAGLIDADNALTITSTNLMIDGRLADATNNLGTIQARQPITLDLAKIELTEGSSLKSAGDVTITVGNMNSAGLIASGRNLSITSPWTQDGTGGLTSTGTLNARANVMLDSADMMTLGGTVLATEGTLRINAGWDLTFNERSTFTGATGIAITAAGRILAGPQLDPENFETPLNPEAISTFATNGNATLTSEGNINFAAALVAGGSVIMNGTDGVTLEQISRISAGTAQEKPGIDPNINIGIAGNAISVLGNIESNGVVTLDAMATGNFNIGGNVVANGDVIFNSTDPQQRRLGIMLGGSVTTFLGDLNIGEVTQLVVEGSLTASNGNISFSAPGFRVGETGRIAAGIDLTIQNVDSEFPDFEEFMVISGALLAENDLTISDGRLALQPGGSLRAGNDLSFSTVDTAVWNGDATVNGTTYSVGANPLSADIFGSISADGNIDLSMEGMLTVQGSSEIVAGGNVTINAGSAIIGSRHTDDTSARGILAGGTFAFQTASPLMLTRRGLILDGSIRSIGNLTIAAEAEVTATTAARMLSNADLLVNGTAMSLAGEMIGNTVMLTAAGLNPKDVLPQMVEGHLALNGAAVSTGRVAITGNTVAIGTDGSITAYGPPTTPVTLSLNIGDNANIAINATGDLINNGAIWSEELVFMRSAQGDITSDNSSNEKGITAQSLVIQADAQDFNNNSILNISNSALFAVAGAISNSGQVYVTNTLTSNSGTFTNASNAVVRAGTLTIDATDSITNNGTLYSDTRLSLDATGQLLNESLNRNPATIASDAGLLYIEANSLINRGATISSNSELNIQIDAAGFTQNVGTVVNNISWPGQDDERNIFMDSAGIISSKGNITFQAGRSIENINSQIVAGGNISLITEQVDIAGDVMWQTDTFATPPRRIFMEFFPHLTAIAAGRSIFFQLNNGSGAPVNRTIRGIERLNLSQQENDQLDAITNSWVRPNSDPNLTNVTAPVRSASGALARYSQASIPTAAAFTLAAADAGGAAATATGATINPIANIFADTPDAGQTTVTVLQNPANFGANPIVTGTVIRVTAPDTTVADLTALTLGFSAPVALGQANFTAPFVAGPTVTIPNDATDIAAAIAPVAMTTLADTPLAKELTPARVTLEHTGESGLLARYNLNGNALSQFTYLANPDSAYLFSTNWLDPSLFDTQPFFDQVGPDRVTLQSRLGDGFFVTLDDMLRVEVAVAINSINNTEGQSVNQQTKLQVNHFSGLMRDQNIALTKEQLVVLGRSPSGEFGKINEIGREFFDDLPNNPQNNSGKSLNEQGSDTAI